MSSTCVWSLSQAIAGFRILTEVAHVMYARKQCQCQEEITFSGLGFACEAVHMLAREARASLRLPCTVSFLLSSPKTPQPVVLFSLLRYICSL